MSCTAALSIRLPRKRIDPALGRMSPEMVRNVVVLPAPLVPMSVTTSPSSTVKLIATRPRLFLLLLGLGEAVLFGLRRWLVARPLSHVEAEMRAGLYGHLQRLPIAFHDRWASGQLLSRATTDLMLVRMFLAFPLTFLLVNGVTIVVGVIIMLIQDWTLGLVILGPAVPVIVMCVLFVLAADVLLVGLIKALV